MKVLQNESDDDSLWITLFAWLDYSAFDYVATGIYDTETFCMRSENFEPSIRATNIQQDVSSEYSIEQRPQTHLL